MIGSHSAPQHSPTSPWRGEVGERSKNASRVGVKLNHPTPAARKMLAADPPRPGEGEARVLLSSEPITRIPYKTCLNHIRQPGLLPSGVRASTPHESAARPRITSVRVRTPSSNDVLRRTCEEALQ